MSHLTASSLYADLMISMLLPPNIEVLKITPFAWEMPVLWKLVERKAEDPSFLMKLRKVILVRHFRDQSSVRILQS